MIGTNINSAFKAKWGITEENNMDYALKLKYRRKYAGLSQEKAAELLGISRSTLIRYESGETPLPFLVFIKMADIYDFDVFEVLGVHDHYFDDVDMYALVKAHALYTVKKEMHTMNIYDNTLTPDYSVSLRDYVFDTIEMMPDMIQEQLIYAANNDDELN